MGELDELQAVDPRRIGPYWLDYHAWMADLVSSGNSCGSNPNQDTNYVNGGNASAAATTSKNAFLAIWNPMAPQYGQQTYTVTGF